MEYEEALDWLFSQFPAFQLKGEIAYKPTLENVNALCSAFQVDFSKLKFIHVAGTNGKGSTCSLLASIFQESGFKTGLFTSPHILDFTERIKVNGQEIEKEKVVEFTKFVKASNFEVKPSFFEITWVLALQHFIEENCDYCIIETGLGGRLDATNIINPILSIITNIGLDHIQILGDNLPAIASEKVGIIKENVPVIIGETRSELRSIFEDRAVHKNASIYFTSDLMHNDINQNENEFLVRQACILLQKYYGLKLEVDLGIINISKNTSFFGRMQKVSNKPTIIVDAAHNREGIIRLVKQIDEQYKQVEIVFGTTKEKNIQDLVSLFPKYWKVNFCLFSNPRSKSIEDYHDFINKSMNNYHVFEDISAFIKHTQESENKEINFLVTGSFFLLSDFFKYFYKKDLQS